MDPKPLRMESEGVIYPVSIVERGECLVFEFGGVIRRPR